MMGENHFHQCYRAKNYTHCAKFATTIVTRCVLLGEISTPSTPNTENQAPI